jgi:hypothetical protein
MDVDITSVTATRLLKLILNYVNLKLYSINKINPISSIEAFVTKSSNRHDSFITVQVLDIHQAWIFSAFPKYW